MRQSILRRTAEGRTVSVVGDTYRFLATGSQTDGKYAMWEAIVPPGGGPPPHVHSREEESFYILEGELTLMVDGQDHIVGPGSFANMAIGSTHCFTNKTARPVRLIISVAPAGLEEMFFEIGKEVTAEMPAAPPTKEEIAQLLDAAPRYGITLKLPPH